MTTERNKRIGRDSIERAKSLCVCTKKRRAKGGIEAGDDYFEKTGWWLSSAISRIKQKKGIL